MHTRKRAAAMLAALLLVGCSSSPVAPQEPPHEDAQGAASCAGASLRPAEGQSLTVRPGDAVSLIAQDVVDYPCTTPIEVRTADFDAVWMQSGSEITVGEIASDGAPVDVRFSVPGDADEGTATIRIDDATLVLEVEN